MEGKTTTELVTGEDMLRMLSENMVKLNDGKITPAHLNALNNAVGKNISYRKLQLEVAKATNKQPNVQFFQLEEKVAPAAA